MAIDTSIYNSLLRPPKTIAEYDAEAQQAQANKLNLAMGQQNLALNQQKAAEYQRGLEQQNALRSLVRGFGSNDEENIRSLYQGGFMPEAQGYAKSIADIAKTRAEATAKAADTDKTNLANAMTKQKAIVELVSSATDQPSWARAKQMAGAIGADVSQIPDVFDPVMAADLRNKALTAEQRLAEVWKQKGYDLDVRKVKETERSNREAEAISRAGNLIKAQEVQMGGKPPPGYRWAEGGRLEAIPGGPGDKLPESQQKQVIGTQNLSNAIAEYRAQLPKFGKLDALSPDARAAMGTKYNNMMLQAKEAYNLGVLNGPDLDILSSVITDPRSVTGVITSKEALDAQASELDRIMKGISAVSAQRRPQDAAARPGAQAPTAAGKVLRFDANGNPI